MPTRREREMLHAAQDAGITSRAELANFMAQISAESRNLTALEESFNYTRGIEQIPVRWARREGDAALESARLEAVRGRPEALAELMYGERMGNDDPGDGYRYRGRGYIQLTGRDNYRETGQALDLDLESDPALAADPENAARIAVSFWQEHVPATEREDVLASTRRINGGINGLAHRQAQYERWHAVLTPEFLIELERSRPSDFLREQPGPAQPAANQDEVRQDARDEQVRGPQASLDPRDAAHPDHAMYLRIRSGVSAIDESNGKPYDEASERISRCLLARCRGADAERDTNAPNRGGVVLQRVDHVVMGSTGTLLAIQGRLDDPAQRRIGIPVADAGLVPAEESDRRLAAVNAQANRESTIDQQQGVALRLPLAGHAGRNGTLQG